MLRISAIIAVVVGLGLIGFTLTTSLFSRTAAAERITDAYRPQLSASGLASTRADYDLIARGRSQFLGGVVPALQSELRLSPNRFDAFVRHHFPAVPRAVATFPTINSFVGPFIRRLQARRATFASADSLPFLGLPITATAWLIAGLGAALALAGGVALLTGTRAATLAVAVLGVAAVAVPLAASIPSKAADARTMTDLGGQVLNPKAATFAESTTTKVDALVRQVTEQMIPAVAQRLHTTPAAFTATLRRRFPATTTLLQVWPRRLSAKAHAIARGMRSHGADLTKVDAIPLRALAWIVVVPGLLVALAAGSALRGDRRRVRGAAPVAVAR